MRFSCQSFSSHVLSLLDASFLPLPQSFLVAFSGGLDSTVLLHLMQQWRQQNNLISVRAIHVNHQLQSMSDDWEKHCQRFCNQFDVDFVAVKVNISSTNIRGVEAAARESRYQVFSENLRSNEILLTAHHQDDQVETLMLRLLRGCGVEGAAAMREIKSFAAGLLLRPLLNFDRKVLEQYALAYNLSWVDDPSNADNSYDRNYLRNEILPMIEKRWPSYRSTLQRFSANAQENTVLLHNYVERDYFACVTPDGHLSLQLFKQYELAQQAQILRMWISHQGFEIPSKKQLQQIFLLVVAKEDANPLVTWANTEVRRFKHHLYIMPPLGEFDCSREYAWNMKTDLYIQGCGMLKALATQSSILPDGVMVRFRREGELLQLPNRKGHHSLKKLFQENNIPPWLRDRTPVICLNSEIIAIPGIFNILKNVTLQFDRQS